MLFVIPEDDENTGFHRVSFYLKACFTKSEIRKGGFFRNRPFRRIRRP